MHQDTGHQTALRSVVLVVLISVITSLEPAPANYIGEEGDVRNVYKDAGAVIVTRHVLTIVLHKTVENQMGMYL